MSERHDPTSRAKGEGTGESELTQEEVNGRIIYSLLGPAVHMARAFGVPMKDLGTWVELAYVKDLMDRGVTLKEASERLQVSVRKISMLTRQLRENFFAPEEEHELPARIEFMLWAEPLSRKRIKQYLSEVEEEFVDETLDKLLEDGRIALVQGRTPTYTVVRRAQRLVRDDLMAKVDALNTLLDTLVDAIYGRFFKREPKAFARTLQLRVRAEDLQELAKLYEEHIWETLKNLDAAAEDDPNAIPFRLALFWAPDDLMEAVLRAERAHRPQDDDEP